MPYSFQPSLPLDHPFTNRGLFADHFLNDPRHLRNMPEWQQAAGLAEAFDQITQLFLQRRALLDRANEAQTENDFIRPVFDILWGGDCYQVQPSIPNADARRQPDYAFFRTASERDAAQPRLGTLDYWRDAACLGDAKKWA